jgi:hypothetical protein
MCDTVKRHYVRPGTLPGGSDIKMYDVGNLNFGTDGNINANEIGELWVHYTGKFYVQVLESVITAPNNNQVALFQSSAPESVSTSVSTTLALASAVANGIGAVNSAGSIVLPEGNYLLDYVENISSSSALVEAQALLEISASTVAKSTFDAVAIAASGSWYFQSNGSSPLTLVVNASSSGTIVCSGSLRITSV